MSNNNLSFWINVPSNTLMSGWRTTAQAQQPVVMQGDGLSVEVHMIDNSNGQSIEIPFPQGCSLKCAVGNIDKYPTGGYFVFTYGSDSVNIPVSSSIATVNSLINGLPTISAAGGVVVSFVNGTTYRLIFNTFGSKLESSIDSTKLYPKSIASTRTIIEGSSSLNEIQHLKIRTAPVAYADAFTLKATPTLSIQEITSSIFRIKLSEQARLGNFTISNGTKTTAAISLDASASDVQAYMLAAGLSVLSNAAGTKTYSVSKPDDYSWDISRTQGTYEALTINPIGIIGFSTMTGSLNVNSYEIEDLLGGNPSVSAVLEIELTNGNNVQTLYQGLITISNDLIDDGIYEPTVLPTVFEDAPHDGILYGRIDGTWQDVTAQANLTGYALESWVTTNFYSNSNPSGYIQDAGSTSATYGRNSGQWVSVLPVTGGTITGDLSITDSFNSGLSSVDLSSGSINITESNKNLVQLATFGFLISDVDDGDISSGGNVAQVTPTEISIQNGDGNGSFSKVKVLSTGITFPDNTVQTTAATGSGTWGSITGTLANQTDLQSELNAKLSIYGGNVSWLSVYSGSGCALDLDSGGLRFTNGGVFDASQATSASLPDTFIQDSHFLSLADTGFIKAQKGDGSFVYNSIFELKSDNFEYEYLNGTDIGSVYKQIAIGDIQQYPLLTLNEYSYVQGDPIFDTITGDLVGYEIAQDRGSKSVIKSDSIKFSNSVEGIVSNVGTTNETYSYIGKDFIKTGITPYPTYPSYPATNEFYSKVSHNGVKCHIKNQFADYYTELTPNGLRFNDGSIQTTAALSLASANNYALKSGTTFTGKVTINAGTTVTPLNIGSGSTPATTVAGDIWMASNTISYRDNTNIVRTIAVTNLTNTFSVPQVIATVTGATTPALRITNLSTMAGGHSLLVEDDANPDATSFIITNTGNVGIGVPTGYTATNKLEVVGSIKANSITFDGTKQFSVSNTQTNPFGSGNMSHTEYPLEMTVSYNGSTYAMPVRLVSTP